MKVRLLLFAVLKDIVGAAERTMSLPQGSRAIDVWEALRNDHDGLRHYKVPPMTAVNQTYVSADTTLHDGDEVAFIPPVAGGM